MAEQRLSVADHLGGDFEWVCYELVVRVRGAELAARTAVVRVVGVLRIEHEDNVLEDEVEDPLALVVVAAQVAAGRVGRDEREGGGGHLGRGSRGAVSGQVSLGEDSHR